jgi:hypothetical protein
MSPPEARTVDVDLGLAGLTYIKDCLADGRTLSHLLLERPDLGRGRVFTRLWSDMTGRPEDFSTAIKVPRPGESTDGSGMVVVEKPTMNWDLAARIQSFVDEAKDRLGVLENPMANTDDEWLLGVQSKLLTLGPDVYHVLDSSLTDIELIQQTIRDAITTIYPPMVGILTRGQIGTAARRNTTTEELRRLAEHATVFFVSAYRVQAFLYWCVAQEGIGQPSS